MAAVTAVLENVGASLTLVTVSTYVSLTDAPDVSVQVTVIVCVPTSAFTGVPDITPELIDKDEGAPDIVYVSESPTSTSVHIDDASRLYEESSLTDASTSPVETVGASFVFATTTVNVSVAVAPAASVAVMVTAWLPTSELVGVPVRAPVVASKDIHVGMVVPVRVTVSPTSTSDAVAV